jgi:hypothetical protein
MATVVDVLAKYRALNVGSAAYEAAVAHREKLVEIQKDQLWAGKNLRGEDLTPSILDDPYFVEKAQRAKAKDVQAAAREMAQEWSDFKDTQRQWVGHPEFGERRRGYANLIFTTGRIVWNPLGVEVGGDELHIATEPSLQRELEAKYGPVFGLNPVGVRYFNDHYFRESFFANIRKQLGL